MQADTQWCPNCRKDNPEQATYCMHCGRKLSSSTKYSRKWVGKIIKVADGVDVQPILHAALIRSGRKSFASFEPGNVSFGDFCLAFKDLSEKNQQVLIRSFGLDRGQFRPDFEISGEIGVKPSSLKKRREAALFDLYLNLRRNLRTD